VSNPTAHPSLPPEPPSAPWLLAPADLAAISAEPALLHRLAAGEQPDESTPVALRLEAWLREVANGGTR
jgi:hypothetical protein